MVQPSQAPSVLDQLGSLASRCRSLLRALQQWLAALFKFRRPAALGANGANGVGAAISPSTPSKLEWNGVRATSKELESISFIRSNLATELTSGKLASTAWLQAPPDQELLRFIRHHNGNKDAALKSVKAHAQWRVSPYGSETILRDGQRRFAHSPLNKEVFWLGPNKSGCPTLVVRTRAHDGANYNDDPKVFSR